MNGTTINQSGLWDNGTTVLNPTVSLKLVDSYIVWLMVIVSTLGIISNIILIAQITRDKKLHIPTFVVIACLSVADLLFSVSICIWSIAISSDGISIWTSYFQIDNETIFPGLLDFLFWVLYCSSIAHVALLSGIRYVTLVHPMKARVWITNRRVVLTSVLIWITSVVCSGSILVAQAVVKQEFTVLLAGSSFLIISWYVTTFAITCVLHVLKVRNLRESPSLPDQAVRRISITVTMVITTFVILLMPHIIGRCIQVYTLYALGELSPGYIYYWFDSLIWCGLILSTVSCSCNPVIYAFFSPVFRESLLDSVSCKKRNYRNQQTGHPA
jgi:hypothetical protein